jgi:hypothetical protein
MNNVPSAIPVPFARIEANNGTTRIKADATTAAFRN